MRLFRFLFQQFFVLVPTLLLLVTLSFFLMRLAPGGPFDGERPLDPIVLQNLMEQYNLDKPLFQQYLLYMKDLIVHLDLGPSMTMRDYTVNELIGANLSSSLWLGFWAMLYSTVAGVALGVLAANRQNTWLDYVSMSFSMAGIVIPSFVLAPVLILIFSVGLHILPAGSYNQGVVSYILPSFALGLSNFAIVARMMRGSMIEVLNSNYIRTARAKGLAIHLVLYRHALKAAILPVVSYLGPAIATVLTGSVVVETIFSLPGIGRYYVQAALSRDYPLVLGVTIVYATLLLIMNFLVDILYGYLDPKVR